MLWPGPSQVTTPLIYVVCYLIWENKLRDEDEREISHWMNKESAALLIYKRNIALEWNKIKTIKNKLFNFNTNQVLVLHFLDSQYQN